MNAVPAPAPFDRVQVFESSQSRWHGKLGSWWRIPNPVDPHDSLYLFCPNWDGKWAGHGKWRLSTGIFSPVATADDPHDLWAVYVAATLTGTWGE